MELQRYKGQNFCLVATPLASEQWGVTIYIELCRSLETMLQQVVTDHTFATQAEAIAYGCATGRQRIDAGWG
jgi:hypothetical protein